MSRGLGRTQRAVFEVLPRHHETHKYDKCGCLRACTLAKRTSRKCTTIYQALYKLQKRGLVEQWFGRWERAPLVSNSEGCRNKRTINRRGALNRLAALEPRPLVGSVYQVRRF